MIIINDEYIATHLGLLRIENTDDCEMIDFKSVVDNIKKIDLVAFNKYDLKIWADWKVKYRWQPDMAKVNMF